MSREFTRKRFLQIASTGAACVALPWVAGCDSSRRNRQAAQSKAASNGSHAQTFRSRPELRPPAVEVRTPPRDTAPGYVFIVPDRGPGQYGPMILDSYGEPVWFHHKRDVLVRDFRAQSYQGRPVLTWWEGEVRGTRGIGEYVVIDASYTEIARFAAGNGRLGDLHEFSLTPRDTALITAYNWVHADLSSLGGSQAGGALEGVAQEIDPETGEVLFEWRSLDHVPVEESYLDPPGDPRLNFDYFHINSVEVDHDGDFIISARNTWTVYKIGRDTGRVLWRLGGKESDFRAQDAEGPGTEFAYQHDARRQPDGTLTIFDNGAAPQVHEESRVIVLELDEERMEVSLVREYTHPGEELLAGFLGNAQALPNGNVFVGWGSEPYFSEFSRDGELLFDARMPPEYTSYRSYRLWWSGYPADKPALAVGRRPGSGVTLYASWNGATEVASWQALAGPAPDQLRPAASVAREGFETSISLDAPGAGEPLAAVRARDRSGRSIGVSETVEI